MASRAFNDQRKSNKEPKLPEVIKFLTFGQKWRREENKKKGVGKYNMWGMVGQCSLLV